MKKFAVLIDGDNSSYKNIEPILEEIAKYGIASVKRIYGDWSTDTLKGWRDTLLPNAITPIQQFAYVVKKDATDMKLVIDAMDLLYAGEMDGFCIISSDSDFTPLASRIRESGLLCYGFGKKNTVESFKNACDKFIYVENLLPTSINKTKENIRELDKNCLEVDATVLNLLYRAIKETSDETDGWANLGSVGSYINSIKPDFDTRSYGEPKLSTLFKNLPAFETKIRNNQLLVRKFNFRSFNQNIQELLHNKKSILDTHGWALVTDIVEILFNRYQQESDFKHLIKEDIKNKVNSIHSNWIEFSKDKKKIRNLIQHENTTE